MMRTVGVEILHLVLLERGFFNRICRAKAMFKRGAGTNISQLGLNHGAQVAGRVMSEFEYFARFAFKNDNHTAPNLCSRNSHICDVSPLKRVGLLAKCVVYPRHAKKIKP